MVKPLTDKECQSRIERMLGLIEKNEQEKAEVIEKEENIESIKSEQEIVKKKNEIDKLFERKTKLADYQNKLFVSRIKNSNRIKLLQVQDQVILDVVLAVHNRLGKVDHQAHRKAYRRIMYALILQGLCKLMEPEVIARFRECDLIIGKSVFKQAEEQYKEMSGRSVKIHADTKRYLSLESCGGVDLFNTNQTIYIRNSLSVKLDRILHATIPLMKLILFGPNPNRKYYDLSSQDEIRNKTLASMEGTLKNKILGNDDFLEDESVVLSFNKCF